MTTLQNDGVLAMFIFFLSISGKQRDPYVDDLH